MRLPMAFLTLALLALPGAAQFYVSPDGDDDNPGTAAKPFATLTRAQDAVRAELADGEKDDIRVWLKGGTYRLAETLVLGLPDGAARDGQRIRYSAAPGEKPIISGAAPLPGPWTKAPASLPRLPQAARGRVWVADVPEDWPFFRTLYDGKGALPRARSRGIRQLKAPPKGASQPIDVNHLYVPPDALQGIADFAGAEMVVVPQYPWVVNILPVTRVERAKGLVVSKVPATYPLGPPRFSRFPHGTLWFENVLEALDEPGEWVLDGTARKLYLWPRDGEAPGQDVVAPRLTELVRVEGRIDYDGPTDTPVRGIVFEGLTFAHADRWPWEVEKPGWGLQHDWEFFDRPTALLRFRGAGDCRVERCRFVDTGGTGVRLDLHCQRIAIRRCEVAQVGGVGVLLAGYGMGTKDANRDNVVADCHVHHVGRLLWHSPGIFAWQSGHNRIEHNHVHHTAYTGIVVSGRTVMSRTRVTECSRTIRWPEADKVLGTTKHTWAAREPLMHGRHNLVAQNDLHHCMEILGDGNAIYISGTGDANRVVNNFVHDIPSPNINANIRCDDDQHGVTIERNVIRNNIVYNLRAKAPDGTPACHQRGFIVIPSTPVAGSVVERNLFVSTVKGQRVLTERPKPWKRRGRPMPPATLRSCRADRNLYFNLAEPGWGKKHLAAQRPFGIEKHSIEADPRFRDPAKDDFRLLPDSPARALGFEEIDLSRVGPRGAADPVP